MKKVLIVTHEFPPTVGGAGNAIFDIAKEMKKQGVELTIVTSHIKNRQNNMFNIIEVKSIAKIRPLFFYLKIKALNLKSFDGIIMNGMLAAAAGALFLKEDIQKKCIVYLHGLEYEFLKNQDFFKRSTKFTEKYLTLLKNCNRVIAVSEAKKRRIMEALKAPELAEKIMVIKNAVNGEIFYPEKIDLYEKYNIPKNRKLILSVSRVVKEKGYDDMLEMLRLVLKNDQNHHWIIVGDGNYLLELKERIKEFNLSEYVTFVGKVQRDELRKYYSSADIFVLLSRFHEAYGLIYLEANSCGIPAIGRDLGGVKEVIEDNRTGFVVQDEIECSKIILEQNYLKFDREYILGYVSRFSIEDNVKKIMNII